MIGMIIAVVTFAIIAVLSLIFWLQKRSFDARFREGECFELSLPGHEYLTSCVILKIREARDDDSTWVSFEDLRFGVRYECSKKDFTMFYYRGRLNL